MRVWGLTTAGGARLLAILPARAAPGEGAGAEEVGRLPDDADGGDVADLVAAWPGTDAVLLVANPVAVVDAGLLGRAGRVLDRLAGLGPWSVATAEGLDLWGHPVSAVYALTQPSLNVLRSELPVIDATAESALVSAAALEAWRAREGDARRAPLASWPQVLVIEGLLDGRLSLFAPGLCVGLNGSRLAREPERHRAALAEAFAARLADARIPTLEGPADLAGTPARPGAPARPRLDLRPRLDRVAAEVAAGHAPPLSLSIVTRTRFARPHLLRRMLTSISRARVDGMALEVVLSTDAPAAEAEAAVAALRDEFRHVPLRLQVNDGRHGCSRVDNLIGGLLAARLDHVAVVDDDDHLADSALEMLRPALALGARPVLAVTTELARERWEHPPAGAPVLAATRPDGAYPASGWRDMFHGVNQLPICGLILPREWMARRLADFRFDHDLSEDYTLWLLLLTAPDLPRVQEIPETFCIVSVRDDASNTVTMTDRGPWVRDITLFIHDLAVARPQAGEGALQLLASRQDRPAPPPAGPARLREGPRLRREIALLQAENLHLQALLERKRP